VVDVVVVAAAVVDHYYFVVWIEQTKNEHEEEGELQIL
jgi:hypothetical protein